jgi:hypothetical protein
MEPKTLNNFMNEMKTKGLRKQNQFQIVITTGDADIDDTLQNITMWANNAELPERTQNFAEVFYHGYPFQQPTNMTMTQETAMTIKSDGDGEIRRACLAWEAKTSNPAITDGAMGEGDKKIPTAGNVRILCFADDMETVTEIYKLVGASVMTVGALEFSNENADIATFELTIKYQYWELEEAQGKFNDIR